MRSLAALVLATSLAASLATSVARAAPDPRACAEKAIAAAPEKERAGLQRWLGGNVRVVDIDAAEKRALADSYDPVGELVFVLESAIEAGDTRRAQHLVDVIEATATAKPPEYDHDKVRRELELARANALVGRAKQARAHLAAVEPKLAKPGESYAATDQRELLILALTLRDEALAKTAEAALLDALVTEKKPGRTSDLSVEARFIAYAGFGRRALTYVDRFPGEHDEVLAAVLEAVKAHKDLPLALEILAKLTGARGRLLELEQLWINLDDKARRSPAFLAAVRGAVAVEPKPDVDDFARGQLVQVLADVGMVKEAQATARRITNIWSRAHAEAMTAAGLVLVDRDAGLALARQALADAATTGFRTDVDNDTMEISAATSGAALAFARGGELAEATKLGAKVSSTDIVAGLRDKPADLAAWWKRATPLDRATVLVEAAVGNPVLGGVTLPAEACR